MSRRGPRDRHHRFSRSERPRNWRKGRYALIGLPAIDADHAIFERHRWGSAAFALEGETSPVQIRFLRAPQGLVMVAQCRHCGGRQEGVLDAQAFFDEAAAGGTPDALEHLEQTVAMLVGSGLDHWRDKHVDCATSPVQYHTPQAVQSFVDSVLGTATDDIRAGDEFPGHLFLLTSDKRVFASPIYDLPQSQVNSPVRRVAMAERKAQLRAMIQARDLDLLAAVVVAEAWVSVADPEMGGDPWDLSALNSHPWMDPDRSESLIATVVTHDFARMGMARIERAGGQVDEGPGRVEPMGWQPLLGPAALVDGLLATAFARSMSGAEAAERAGIELPLPSLD